MPRPWLHLLESGAPAVTDPATQKPLADAKARIDHLVQTLEKKRERIIVPTPALSEVLVHANDAMASYLEVLNNTSRFRIASFDQRAAIELAAITRDGPPVQSLRVGASSTRASLKFDRQIVAIARVEGETTIYSDDADMGKLGESLDFKVIRTYDLPIPPEEQTRFFVISPAGFRGAVTFGIKQIDDYASDTPRTEPEGDIRPLFDLVCTPALKKRHRFGGMP